VPAAQRKAFVAAMTADEMRALIEALLDLEISFPLGASDSQAR
jgi:hypothetical protein